MALLFRALADVIVLCHLAYVATVVGGLVLILVGAARGWKWIRNVWLRVIHLGMIALVAAESLLGIACPLTVWEAQLRTWGGEEAHAGSFVERLVHAVLFFDAPLWVFTLGYCLFTLAVAAAWVLAPPRWGGRRRLATTPDK